jgi:uncharacterized membrane protein YqiK
MGEPVPHSAAHRTVVVTGVIVIPVVVIAVLVIAVLVIVPVRMSVPNPRHGTHRRTGTTLRLQPSYAL